MRKLTAGVLGSMVATAGSLVVMALPAGAAPVTVTFPYAGGTQTWTVPAGVTAVAIDAYGAQGGRGAAAVTGGPAVAAELPGLGGRATATLTVTPGEQLDVNVGGRGGNGSLAGATSSGDGGFNGGGGGPRESGASAFCNGVSAAGGGGGASDVRQGGNATGNRVVVAAGGGGAGGGIIDSAGAIEPGGPGGDGGGTTGETSGPPGIAAAGGGTPTVGGAGGAIETSPSGGGFDGTDGSLLNGGFGGSFIDPPSCGAGGGGGGGLFGGGGGGATFFTRASAGGGGGSSAGDFVAQGVRAGNGIVTITYTPVAVPGAPTGVSAAPGNGQATVSFTPPANEGGAPITGYTATCGDNEASGVGSPLVVTPLANGVTVNCTVHATNAGGDGPESSPPVSVTPQALSVPGAPTGVVATRGDAKATVSFSPPGSTGGSPILDYTATCGTKSKTGASSPLVVTALTNGVTVTCTVTARNAQGTGPPSAPPVPVKPATVPGAPVNVSAIAGNAQATVKFAKPLSNGGSGITSYTATCGSKSKSGAGSPLVVTGLANGITVHCTVRATNAVGSGPASSPPVAVKPRP